MQDLYCIIAMVALTALALWYVAGCEHLKESRQ